MSTDVTMDTPAKKQYNYFAFISYKSEDEKWAGWLQRKLERYRLPNKLVKEKGVPRNLYPIFRYVTDLTPGILEGQLKSELQSSKYLIVVCSRQMQKDPEYIDFEIASFLMLGNSASRIIPLIVDGEPNAEDPTQECYPPALLKLGDAIPLGVDVRKESRQDLCLKIIAAMLEIRFNDLKEREKRRQRRNILTWSAILCVVFATALTAGIRAYIYYTPHTAYYADYIVRYGVPEGIFPMTVEQTRHMGVHYAITSTQGKVRTLRTENSFGRLVDLHDELKDRPARAEYKYNDNGRLNIEEHYDSKNQPLVVINYSPDLTQVILTKKPDSLVSSTLIANTSNMYDSLYSGDRSPDEGGISHLVLEYDEHGYLTRQLYATGESFLRTHDIVDIWGRAFCYDSVGRVISVDYLTYQNGNYIYGDNGYGVQGKQYKYNDRGCMVEITYFDKNHHPISNSIGWAVRKAKFDTYYNCIREEFMDAECNLAPFNYGYSSSDIVYDDNGNMIRQAYFGTDGQPAVDYYAQYAARTIQYDDKGNPNREFYFGLDGQPILVQDGYAGWTKEYDQKGNETKYTWLGLDGLPILVETLSGIYAGWIKEYDEYGHETRITYLGADAKPILIDGLYAGWIKEYDGQGRETKCTYVDNEGKLAIGPDGFAYMTMTFKELINASYETAVFYGIDEKPILLPMDGIAGYISAFDEETGERRDTYLGTDGQPIMNYVGCAGTLTTYDEYGRVRQSTCLGLDGKPVNNKYGWSILNIGNGLKLTYYKADGSLIE